MMPASYHETITLEPGDLLSGLTDNPSISVISLSEAATRLVAYESSHGAAANLYTSRVVLMYADELKMRLCKDDLDDVR